MKLAFAGAHRSGKTTLAQLFERRQGLVFVQSDAGRIATELGFDMGAVNSIDDRLAYQQVVMESFCERIVEAGDSYVCDRTPIDMAAYLMADMQAATGTPEQQEACIAYMDMAISLTSKLFDCVFAVAPGIPVAPHPHKPPVNAAYQWHHHMLVVGMLSDCEADITSGFILPDCLNIEDRYWAVEQYLIDLPGSKYQSAWRSAFAEQIRRKQEAA